MLRTKVRDVFWENTSSKFDARVQQQKTEILVTHTVTRVCPSPTEAARDHVLIGSRVRHLGRFSVTDTEFDALGRCAGDIDGGRTMIIGGGYNPTSLGSPVNTGHDLPDDGGIELQQLTIRERVGECPAGLATA